METAYHSFHTTSQLSKECVGLPPFKFHSIHGEHITISRDGAVARRNNSFCKGVAFTNRPVEVNERVYLKFVETTTKWSGALAALRFGFTSVDPNQSLCFPRKYASSDLTNKLGHWTRTLEELQAQKDSILFYYVNETGHVHYGINGKENGNIFQVVNTCPLWGAIGVYGSTVAVELVTERHLLNGHRRPGGVNPTTLEPVTNGRVLTSNECRVCFDRIINCVLYDCGHLCLCYQCAQKQWESPLGGFCPICRKEILDVVRIYRA